MNMLLHGIPDADIRQEDTIRRPQHRTTTRAEALRPRDRQSAVQPELHHEGHQVSRPLRRLDAGERQEGRLDVRAAHARRAQGLTQALSIYAEEDAQDIQQGLQSLSSELPILEERYQRLVQHFRSAEWRTSRLS